MGIVAPQRMLANVYNADHLTVTTSDDGKTVTINSTQASALWSLLNGHGDDAQKRTDVINALQAATGTGSKIVFTGDFSGDDLKKLSENNCCVQETVDMAEATFKKHVELETAMNNYKIHLYSYDNHEGDVTTLLNTKATSAGITPVNGDVAVYETTDGKRSFYQYNNNTWAPTEHPCFASKERLEACVTPNNDCYAMATVDGKSQMFEAKTDPEHGIHSLQWMPMTSENAYDDMTFSYWGSNVKTAITSRNAGPDDTLGMNDYGEYNLTQNCSNLTNLTINSGHVSSLGGTPPLQSVTIGNGVSYLGKELFKNDNIKNNLQSVTFNTGGTTPLVIDESCFMGCRNVTNSFTIPARTTTISSQAFKEFGPDPETTSTDPFVITFEDSSDNPSQLSTFVASAFHSCGITSLTIPSSITEIESGAFQQCYRLETIRFGETTKTDAEGKQVPLIIKSGAFCGGKETAYKLKDVYVDINPKDRLLICEYNAFPYVALVGQTDVTNEQVATLHFREDYFGFYAGDWKRGMTFTQNNLNQIKDGITEDREVGGVTYTNGSTQNLNNVPGGITQIDNNNDGLYHPEDNEKKYAPGNGWQQFARTNTGIDVIIPAGKYFRTYSTEEAQAKPEWMELYRITNFSDGFNENSDASSRTQADAATKSATAKKITNTETGNNDLIPAKTGVIRVDNVTEDALYYFMDWSLTMLDYDNSWEFPYNEDLTNNAKVNFMKPTNDSPKEIGPVVKEGGVITHRIFGLLASGEFSRAKHMTMKENRAYLQLPASMFHWKDETTHASQDATTGATASQYSKISMVFDMELEDVFGEGVATEIKKAIENEEYKNDTFYTLQGVRVAKPTTKGVYIHNGKKILVK